jgi:hypothetical protein
MYLEAGVGSKSAGSGQRTEPAAGKRRGAKVFKQKKTSNLLWGNPRGLRLRASLRVSLRIRMFPDTPGILGIAVKQ